MSVAASGPRLPSPPPQARPDLRFFTLQGNMADAGLPASGGGGWFWLMVGFRCGGGHPWGLVGMGSAPFGPGRDDDGLAEANHRRAKDRPPEAKQFTSGDQRQDSNKRMQTQHMAHDARADDLPFEDVNDDEVPQDQRGDDQSPGGKGNHDIGDSGGNGADMGINSRINAMMPNSAA